MTLAKSSRLRFLTYNIHGCMGRGGLYHAGRILEILREVDADFVALQEVYDEKPRDRQFLADLEKLSYPEIEYGITMIHKTRGAYGNVFLSKWPLEKVEKIDLSVPPFEPRGAILARADTGGLRVDIAATHLGLNKNERAAQVLKLMHHWNPPMELARTRSLFCLAGDLNEWAPAGEASRLLRETFGRSRRLRTFPARFPAFALDQILVIPPARVEKRFVFNSRLSRRASDHLPLVADVVLPG